MEKTIIKKYSNRRLYNTDTSDYINLDDVYDMVKQNVDFIVQDAKTGEDLTKIILTQVIFERESRGVNLLSINFLRKIIGFYDDSLKVILPEYLEQTMETFTANQEMLRNVYGKYIENIAPFTILQELTKHNIKFFNQWFFNDDK